MPPRRSYRFSERTGRYRGPDGRFVRQREIRAGVDSMIDGASQRIRTLTESLRSRQITVGEWEQRMRAEVSALHVAAATAAKGGRDQMSSADYGRVGRLVRDQFDFLRSRADAIVSGKQLMDGTLVQRATLYAQAARGTHSAILAREMDTRGFSEERNILDREAAHCVGAGSCPEQTARGWVPVGSLVPLSQRLCGPNDRCSIQYRNPATGEVAA